MNQTVDIRELNERIEKQSSFVDALIMGMDKTIIGQKHLVESLLIGLLADGHIFCLLYTSPSPRDRTRSRMPSSA
jgi:MoxR-like ATPase